MTQAEKQVLRDIITAVEKLSQAVLKIQESVPPSGNPARIPRTLDTLRNSVDALPSE